MPKIDLCLGDCAEVLKGFDSNSIDAIVCDPPYGICMMNKEWDGALPGVEVWAECFRVLKPGGHLLAFAGTRTQHHMATRIEHAEFEIRDMLAWVYGSGFPKSRNLHGDLKGWGSALKPAFEPITMARKPLRGTLLENMRKHGVGALHIDACRIPWGDDVPNIGGRANHGRGKGYGFKPMGDDAVAHPWGRWPANFMHDGSDQVQDVLGSACRFFYCPKPTMAEREEGLEGLAKQKTNDGRAVDADNAYQRGATLRANHHPTVKPMGLMRTLCRLVTPSGGLVLDPFMGCGTTGRAALAEGFDFIGIEKDPGYFELAQRRVVVPPQGEIFQM